MKIELTMTEMMVLVDMIADGRKAQEEKSKDVEEISLETTLKCAECGSTENLHYSVVDFLPHCPKHLPLVDIDLDPEVVQSNS